MTGEHAVTSATPLFKAVSRQIQANRLAEVPLRAFAAEGAELKRARCTIDTPCCRVTLTTPGVARHPTYETRSPKLDVVYEANNKTAILELQPVNASKQGRATTSYVVFGVIGSAIANEILNVTERSDGGSKESFQISAENCNWTCQGVL